MTGIKAVQATAAYDSLKIRVVVPVRGDESVQKLANLIEDAQIKYLIDNAKAILNGADHTIELIKKDK